MAKPYVIGIAGGTCSGKSTLCDTLEQQLRDYHVQVFHMDRYYKEHPPTVIAPITKKEYPEFNHPNALKLEELYRDFQNAIADSTLDFVIIEGLFALYLDEIRNQLDIKIFVDLQSDERAIRRVQRHLSFGDEYEEIVSRYLDTVRFRHNELVEPTRWHADMVINGALDMHKGTDILFTYIKTQRTSK